MFKLEAVHDYVATIRIDPSELTGQELNKERYDWYVKRFEWLLADGLPDAINCYLEKLKEDTECNNYTKLQLVCLGTRIMDEAAMLKFESREQL